MNQYAERELPSQNFKLLSKKKICQFGIVRDRIYERIKFGSAIDKDKIDKDEKRLRKIKEWFVRQNLEFIYFGAEVMFDRFFKYDKKYSIEDLVGEFYLVMDCCADKFDPKKIKNFFNYTMRAFRNHSIDLFQDNLFYKPENKQFDLSDIVGKGDNFVLEELRARDLRGYLDFNLGRLRDSDEKGDLLAEVVCLRHGYHCGDKLELSQVGEAMGGMNKVKVFRYEKKAYKILARIMSSTHEDFMD